MNDDESTVLSPNTRPAAIKRFLAKPPAKAARLVLSVVASDTRTTVQLGEWDASESVPGLAMEIDASMREHASELNAHIIGTLSFYAENGAQVGGTKVLKYRPESAATSSDSLASTADMLTGDATSQAAQAQKHLEVMQRMMLTSIQSMFIQMRQLNEHTMELAETLANRLAESETRERRARTKADELEEVVRDMASAPEDGSVDASQEKIIKLLEPVLPALLMKLMGGASGMPPAQGGQ